VTVTLAGDVVRLEPLTREHVLPLARAAATDRGSYGFTSVPDGVAATEAYVDELLEQAAAGEVVPFTQVRLADGAVVGATRFLHLRPAAAEIGGTWLAADAQRTGLNREAKLLLLTYAFDDWGLERVDWCTDARNVRSRRAIEGIGATFEGVLRSWQASRVVGEEGRQRDTAIFSVVRAEWPDVRAGLQTARSST
jgi:RimJ/RimL family protein N-acetyltransferase